MAEFRAILEVQRFVSRATSGVTLAAVRAYLKGLLDNGEILGRVDDALVGVVPYADADAIDAIEALGNGVLVTTSGVIDNVVGSTAGDALVWNGTAWTATAVTPVVAWADITGKPATFAPSSHTHTASEITDFNTAWTARLTAFGSGATTGHAPIWNGSAWAAGAYAYSNLSGVPATFAPSSHTHTASEITDFNTAWTAQLTALGSGASVNDTLAWNGSAFVAATPSGGGMTNPMTTTWDLIRGGASGTPTRLAVGSPLTRLSVLPDGTLGYAVGGGRITPGARESIWYTTTTAAPSSVGAFSWARVSTSNTSGVQCKQNGSVYQINGTAASANSHATIGATLVSGSYWIPCYATVYMQTHALATTSTVGLYLATAATVSSNEFFNAPPTANAASSAKQGFGLMWSSADGLTGTFKLIATTTTEYGVVDTGVQWTTDGVTVRDLALMIWEGPTAVYGEIWNVGGASPVRLWGGSLPIVSFATTGLQIVAWSLTKTLAASAAYVVHGMGSAGYMTGLEAG